MEMLAMMKIYQCNGGYSKIKPIERSIMTSAIILTQSVLQDGLGVLVCETGIIIAVLIKS
jgi:hypothetical protein